MRRAVLIGLLVFSLARPAAADEEGLPRLGEHVFIPVPGLAEPFIVTFVQTDIGVGWTMNTERPLFNPIDSTVVGIVKADQLLTRVGFQYQQVAKDWLAVRLAIGVLGRLGTNTSSLITDGITGALGYNLGWMMRVYRSPSVLVSGSVSLSNNSATFINILDWLYLVVAGENASLARPRTSLAGTGAVHAAWGIDSRFGLLGTLGLSYGESFDGTGDNDWYGDFRAGLTYDANRDLHIPLGAALTGGHSENDVSALSDEGTWFWGARVTSKGRSDFSLGLNLIVYYLKSAAQPEILLGETHNLQFMQIAIDMRYYY